MSLNLPDQAFFFFYHVSQTKRDEGTPDRGLYFTDYLKLENSDLINERKLIGHSRYGLRFLMPKSV